MLETLKLILSLLPIIVEAIKAAEVALPEANQGTVKLALVREVLISVDQSLNAVWPLIEKVIGGIVRVFNATGVFKADA